MMNVSSLITMPVEVVTATRPEPVPGATTAVIKESEVTLTLAAGVPPIVTAVAPVKPDPEIATVVPIPPLSGLKPVISGGGNPAKVAPTDVSAATVT
jgi:hypothetical protein